jgi:Polyketide cyclase / dehydrase and lipid transport
MIKKILAGLGVVLGIFMVIAALKPTEYLIKRDIVINAKPEAIFPYLVSSKNADQWMPWKESDPQVQISYSGPEEGLGSTSSWDSPGQMGTGKAEVVGVIANQSVKTKITYSKPMEMTQDSEFILTTQGEATQMTWTVTGSQPFFARLMCTLMFMDMDKYVGGMFERGLNKLKLTVETK